MANAWRGEAELRLQDRTWLLRPSFEALVSAEEELGPLFGLVERAAEGRMALKEMAALFWHCVSGEVPDRAAFSESVAAAGLANATPVLKVLIGQILQGR